MFATKLISRFGSRSAATATVRAVKRRSLIPTRAALTLVRFFLTIIIYCTVWTTKSVVFGCTFTTSSFGAPIVVQFVLSKAFKIVFRL